MTRPPAASGPGLEVDRSPGSVWQLATSFVRGHRGARWTAYLTYAIGFLDILTGLRPHWRVRLQEVTEWVPGALSDAAVAATVVTGVLLVVLAHSLRRRKRRAWYAATLLMGLSVGFHLLHLHVGAAALSLVGLVVLIAQRKAFDTDGDPTTRWSAVSAFVLLALASLVVGVVLVALNRHGLEGGWPGLFGAISYAAQGFVGIQAIPSVGIHDRGVDVANAVLLGLGVMILLVTAYLVFRAPRRQGQLSADDDARLRTLLGQHPDSLGYFATREDKQVVWSQSGKAGIGYRVVNGVMLAAGDPIGDVEAWPGAIRAFLVEADRHAWTPAVLGCSERGGTVWTRETGFDALELGDEAIVDASTFSLAGRPMRNVRQMVNRIERQGYQTQVLRVRDTKPELRAQALHDASAWRHGATERGFSMATSRVLDAERDGDAIVALARKDGRVEGLLQFVPWGSDGMSLDLMRRNPAADPGINELLIVAALREAPALGVSRVSLNFAMFRSTFERGERLGAGPFIRLARRLLVVGNRWFQLESLYRFNAKFEPTWFPRFIVFPTKRSLVRVGLAMGQAEAFIVWPTLRRFGAH